MNTNLSTNRKIKRMLGNILSIVMILAVAFPAMAPVYAQEPMPHIEAFAWLNRYSLVDWPADLPVQITIHNPDYETEPFVPDGSSNWYDFFPGVDLQPGSVITATNGEVTKVLEISPLSAAANANTGNVTGIAVGGHTFQMRTDGDHFQLPIEQDIEADSVGNWSVTIGDYLPWEWLVRGEMWEGDEDGDVTYAIWHVQQQVVEVWLAQNDIRAFGWPLDSALTFRVDGNDIATGVVPEPVDWIESTQAVVNAGDLQLQPGMEVTVTDGASIKSTIVQDVKITNIDIDDDIVYGYGPLNADLELGSWEDSPVFRFFNNGEDQNWLVDYREPGLNGVTVDLNPGDEIRLFLRDEEKDSTVWQSHASGIYTVNTTEDNDDGNCDGAHCSLREAINASNTNPAADTIAFDIPGTPPYTIQPGSALPSLDSPVTIDGTTHPGFDGSPIIELDGSNAGEGVTGLVITSGSSTVQGLVINRFSGSGIAMVNGGENTIRGNFIGTDVTGMVALGNGDGIWLGEGTSNNTIGGTEEGAGNVISGNNIFGVSINHENVLGNVIQGNFIGTAVDGTAAIPNVYGGVILTLGTSQNLIGGTDPEAQNLVSGNNGDGIIIVDAGTSGNVVQGNYLGTDVTGTTMTTLTSGPEFGGYELEAEVACLTYDPGTDREGFISEANDPLAPWSGTSVTFKGTNECGIPEPDTFEGAPLIYRYRLAFDEPTELASIAVSGAAFNGGALRVLDENRNVLGTAYNFGGNSFQTNFVRFFGVVGQVFFVEEYDYSSDWRYRDSMVINGPLPLGNRGSGVLIAGGATNNQVIDNLISGNMANGVAIFNPGTTGNIVQENYIGTDITGLNALGNSAPGVAVGDQAYNNFIIGNLISGNRSDGVAIFNPGTNGNLLQGNNIGTDASGIGALPNRGVGVWIGDGAADTLIGGTDASVRNVISGNIWGGVSINNLQTTGTQVQGNYIGTDKNGDGVLPNGGDGVYISGNENIIGGAESGAGNVISGNTANGVAITEAASANLVQGNYIGTDVMGTTTTGSAGPAVGMPTLTVMPETCPTYDQGTDIDGFVSESADPLALWSGNSVHFLGTEAGCGSPEKLGEASLIYRYKMEFDEDVQLTSVLVSGAAFNGPDSILRVLDENMQVIGTTNTFGDNSYRTPFILLNNVVGSVFYIDEFDTSGGWRFRQSIVINGPLPLGNEGSGVMINSGASSNQILGNLVSGNRSDAIALYHSGTNGNILQGNYIGTDVTGTAALPNTSAAIWIGEGASDTLIGGIGDGEGNLISGNTGDAISINNAETTGTVVQGNFIGTDVTGTEAIPNLSNGIVLVTGTHDNVIGGTEPDAGNVVSGNMGDGIVLVDGGTSDNRVQGNLIGTDVTGMSALGNQYRGVYLGGGASDNLISGNVISANGAAGIRLIDSGTTANRIQGNSIGTDITGVNPLGNGYIGIRLTDGAANNMIGGTEPGAGNTIAFNAATGIAMSGDDVTGNALLSNSVFSNAGPGIDLGEDDVTLNDLFDPDTGPNNVQNFPIITSATLKNITLKVHGQLVSSPKTTYRLEFFSNDSCDPSGYGEGQTYLGSVSVITNPDGVASFKANVQVALPVGMFITATATDAAGNTSEFSQCFGPVK